MSVIATKNVTTSLCQAPIRDRTKIVSGAGLAGGIIALVAFILRMVARLRCCGGVFGMDDWTMMLTMVSTASYSDNALLAHTRQGLLIPLSALSVVCKAPNVDRNECALTFQYSGRHRSRQRHVDTSIRQHHPHSLRELLKTRALCPSPTDMSQPFRYTFGMNYYISAFYHSPRYLYAVSTFESFLTARSESRPTSQSVSMWAI